MIVLMPVGVVVIVDVAVVREQMWLKRDMWGSIISAASTRIFIPVGHVFGARQSLCSCARIVGCGVFAVA